MTILDKIIARKIREVEEAKSSVPIQQMEILPGFSRTCLVFKDFLLDPSRSGIIAEFKRSSPSKGTINSISVVEEVVKGYENAGASAISVLTDLDFFGGRAEDLTLARSAASVPLLRKDFIIDEYQLLEAKAWGADIILLIAAVLTPLQIRDLSNVAQSLGLNVLLEVHSLEELERSLCTNLNAVGVNNRNLADFSVNVQRSHDLISAIPDDLLKISESGISNPETIVELKKAGFNGFLIGENFMRTEDPGKAMAEFVRSTQKL